MCKKRLAMRELCLTQVGHCLYNKYHDEDLDMDCKGWCLLFTQAIVRFCLYNCCMNRQIKCAAGEAKCKTEKWRILTAVYANGSVTNESID